MSPTPPSPDGDENATPDFTFGPLALNQHSIDDPPKGRIIFICSPSSLLIETKNEVCGLTNQGLIEDPRRS